MGISDKVLKIGLTLLVFLLLQVLFVFAETRDTPRRAVIQFTKAYIKFDPEGMRERLCKESRTQNDTDVILEYVDQQRQRARKLGYPLWYMKDCLYEVETHILAKNWQRARIRFHAERNGWVRWFFDGKRREVEETFDVVWSEGKWRVCGNPFSLRG
jgi:hypothetical protein